MKEKPAVTAFKKFSPFNVITIPVISVGLFIITMRFVKGLGAVANPSQDFPWGLLISFNVVIGIALAGGAYVLCCLYYFLGFKKYHPIVRVAVLNSFLAYLFCAGALMVDLGRPWNALNVLIGNKFGFASVLFMVAWHFFLYTLCLLFEFVPAVAEWLELKKAWKIFNAMTLGTVIVGITLSIGHQGGIGGLFLLAKAKIHPLWYSQFIPLLFVVSSIFGGVSMVILLGLLNSIFFKNRVPGGHQEACDRLVMSLAKLCAGSMAVYVFLKLLELIHEQTWPLLFTPMGSWYLFEVFGCVAVPGLFFWAGAKKRSFRIVNAAAIITILGVVVNRLNICLIAYKWYSPTRYFPTWMEVVVTLTLVFTQLWVYRWMANRMPVVSESPEWAKS